MNLDSIYVQTSDTKICVSIETSLLPDSFNNMLVTQQVHSYDTRMLEFFYSPLCRTNIRKVSISFQGLKFFIAPSFKIQHAKRITSFFCKLKASHLSSDIPVWYLIPSDFVFSVHKSVKNELFVLLKKQTKKGLCFIYKEKVKKM